MSLQRYWEIVSQKYRNFFAYCLLRKKMGIFAFFLKTLQFWFHAKFLRFGFCENFNYFAKQITAKFVKKSEIFYKTFVKCEKIFCIFFVNCLFPGKFDF